MKITFLTVMPSPYVQDLFCALAADHRIDLTVWYLEQVAPDTYWGEQTMPDYAKVLPGRWYGFSGARVHWNPGISQLIKDCDADLFVIVGYIGLTNQVAMRTLNRLGLPWVFWGEVPGLHKRNWLGRQVRSLLQRPLCKTSGIAGVGSLAVTAYRNIVTPANPDCVIRNIPYHCRLDEFQQAGQLRHHGPMVRFLYCGQLIHRKGVDLLCSAFCKLLKSGTNATLTLAGAGPLETSLAQMIPEDFRDRIQFLGFQPVDTLPKIFGNADVFVLPSRHDGWGVVVNQAVAAGMPVIATNEVGAAVDLVKGQGTGWVIPADDEGRLLDALREAIADPDRLLEMSRKAIETSERITLRQAATDWTEFFAAAIGDSGRPHWPVAERHLDGSNRGMSGMAITE